MTSEKEINEQEVVLALEDKSVIVSASAGSGKTSTMIRKIFKTLMDKKIDVTKLLVLTYTNAAAAEMKSRLVDILTKECVTSIEKEFLQSQIDKISIADISTFHSFYEKIIRANYYYLNINPAFTILEDSENEILKDIAFSNAIEKFKQDDEKYLKLFSAFNKKRNEFALKQRVEKLFNFLSAQQNEDDWISNNSLRMLENVNLAKQILNNFYNDNIYYFINQFKDILIVASQKDEGYVSEFCNKSLVRLEQLSRLDFEEKRKVIIEEFSLDRFVSSNKYDIELCDKVKKLKKQTTNFFKKIKDENLLILDENSNNFDEIKEKYQLFIEFYRNFKEELNSLKQNNSTYDFSDMEKLALKLLENKAVEGRLKEQYDYVFVDEFQDVNPLQNEILKHLSKGDNLFIVGDPKQSIYAFRQSEVELFNKKESEFKEDANSEILRLQNNYRSNAKILEFCNIVFSNIMTEKTANLNYKESSMFNPMAEIPTKFAPVNILLLQKGNREEETNELKLYRVFDAKTVEASYASEAKLIFNKIYDLLDKEIYDDKIKAFRKIKFSDIAILIRSRGNLTNSLAKIFEDNGVPYVLNAEKDLKKSKFVNALIAALHLAREFYSEIDLATVLNRFFAISYNQFAKIKKEFLEKDFKTAVKEYELNFNDEISEKLKMFETIIKEFSFQISISGIFYALNYLIKNSKFNEFLEEYDSEEEKQMLNSFLKFVQESKFNDNLVMFLNLIEENEQLNVEELNCNGLDQITITTIHSSKGLEYPIVFLSGLNRDNFRTSPNGADIKISKNLGIALRMNDDEGVSIFDKAISIEARKAELAESLRLLYVGLTRAKNHLFLTAEGEFDDIQTVNENNLEFISGKYINYILGSLDDNVISSISQGINFACEDFNIEITSQVDENNNEKNEEFELSQEEKNKILNSIKGINNFKYEKENNKFISQKTSVTEIVNDSLIYENACSEPQNFNLSEHLNGLQSTADIGNAFHEIMERANLDISFENLKLISKDVYEKYLEKEIVLPETFVDISSNLCLKAIQKIKEIVPINSQIFKEKQFMIYSSSKEILNYGSDEKILIQGIIDFFAVGEKVVLIDYKYSHIKDNNKLINKYKNQLKIYAYALEKFLNKKVDLCYLLNLKTGELVEIK